MQEQQNQLQMGLIEAQVNQLNAAAQESAADAQEAQARAQKILTETSLLDDKAKIELIRTLTSNLNSQDKNEFDKRVRTAEVLLKERDIDSNEKIVQQQMMMKQNNA